jgi:hypothetical protein
MNSDLWPRKRLLVYHGLPLDLFLARQHDLEGLEVGNLCKRTFPAASDAIKQYDGDEKARWRQEDDRGTRAPSLFSTGASVDRVFLFHNKGNS